MCTCSHQFQPHRPIDGVCKGVCSCGHLDINHSDIDLEALGNCYECDCKEYTNG
jgi:hypothetical protein